MPSILDVPRRGHGGCGARGSVVRLVARPAALTLALTLAAGCGGSVDADAEASVPAGCPADAQVVSDTDGLRSALASAGPGTVVAVAEGTYAGSFEVTASGTEAEPAVLCGAAGSVLDGGSTDEGYTLHLDGASWWRVSGLTVTGGKKGVMVSAGSDNVLDALTVHGTGDEAVHLRQGSSRNVVSGSTIYDTGLREAEFGEGVYVGSAESSWCDLTACGPDRSDGNVVRANTISSTSAEAVDVKEGTTGGQVVDNVLEGPVGAAVDSLVDVKGNDWVVEGNTFGGSGTAVQVQEVLDGWGRGTVVRGNTFGGGTTLGVEVRGAAREGGTVVACDQPVAGGGGEVSDVPCG